MALNKNDITKTNLEAFLVKIDCVSNQEFDSITDKIYEILSEKKCINSEKHSKESYLDILVNHYLETLSDRVFKILVGLSTPFDECLFNTLMAKINNVQKRQSVLILISNIVHLSPSWLPKLINNSVLNCFFSILKNEQEVVTLGTSALILVELIATLPSVISQCLEDIFNCFLRLSTFLYKKMFHNEKNNDPSFLHLNSIVYRLFLRLYAMYPCNFFHYLKANFGDCSKENAAVFNTIIEPMLCRIRFHPLLITASKDKECDKSRWFYKEPHDIMNECGKYSIDPIEFCPESDMFNNYFFDDLCPFADSMSDDDTKTEENFNGESFDYKCETKSTVGDIKFRDEDSLKNTNTDNANKLNLNQTKSDSFKTKTTEFAQEAITIGSQSCNFSTKQDKSLFSTVNKKVVAPVAISADSKMINVSQQRKNLNKSTCFSPFKPIKDINMAMNTDFKSVKNNKLAALDPDFQVASAHEADNSIEQFNSNNENEDVDMEVFQINNNLEIEAKKFLFEDKENILSSEKTKRENTSCIEKIENKGLFASKGTIENKLADEQLLVGNIKNSLKQANIRIRFQSHCLPETDKETDFYYNYGGDSQPGSLFNLRAFSHSCPKLYFKSEEELQNNCLPETQNKDFIDCPENENAKSDTIKETSDEIFTDNLKAKVSLILENPDSESKRIKSINMKKTCKSVDFTKEAKLKYQHHLQSHRFDRYSYDFRNMCESRKKDFSDSIFSIDLNSHPKVDAYSRKCTPHELLNRMLFLNSELCLRQGNGGRSVAASSLDNDNMTFGNSSGNSSNEHLSSSKNYMSSSEEDMRKQLAIMYAQLLFERHQRDSNVIRNRRLYKKSKEFVQLQEKFSALKDQLKLQEDEIDRLRTELEHKLVTFDKSQKLRNNQILTLEKELELCQNRCKQLESEKSTIAIRYNEEIKSLHQNYRTAELELNKYRCNFSNKNVDLAKIEKENLELKNQIFLFGEFYERIRNLYLKNKSVVDSNDKLLIKSLIYENDVLKNNQFKLTCQLEAFKDKCHKLEMEHKQNDNKLKNRNETDDVKHYIDCLKMKDDRIDSLKTIIVNFEKHILKLYGQISSKDFSNAPKDSLNCCDQEQCQLFNSNDNLKHPDDSYCTNPSEQFVNIDETQLDLPAASSEIYVNNGNENSRI